MTNSSHKLVCYSLGALLAFSALNAFGGGYYALAGAEGVPTDGLKEVPSITILSLVLFFLWLWADHFFLLPFQYLPAFDLPGSPRLYQLQ